MFFVMALDRGNITGVLTSTFLKDANLTRDQANTGTSLLWLGIVILEIPSNVVLQRIGAHYWLPAQCVAWGLAEVLQYKVKGPASWYIARLALGREHHLSPPSRKQHELTFECDQFLSPASYPEHSTPCPGGTLETSWRSGRSPSSSATPYQVPFPPSLRPGALP